MTRPQEVTYLFTVISYLFGAKNLKLLPRRKMGTVKATLGGDEGTRTPGLLRAREALSHLSYIPKLIVNQLKSRKLVGLVGLEPTTSPLSEERSNRLSYRP